VNRYVTEGTVMKICVFEVLFMNRCLDEVSFMNKYKWYSWFVSRFGLNRILALFLKAKI
jgi:hypothetical protein